MSNCVANAAGSRVTTTARPFAPVNPPYCCPADQWETIAAPTARPRDESNNLKIVSRQTRPRRCSRGRPALGRLPRKVETSVVSRFSAGTAPDENIAADGAPSEPRACGDGRRTSSKFRESRRTFAELAPAFRFRAISVRRISALVRLNACVRQPARPLRKRRSARLPHLILGAGEVDDPHHRDKG